MNSYKCRADKIAAFGAGLVVSCLFPEKFVLVLCGTAIIVISFSLRKCR
ncbi:MAG: hypothetical protein K6F76_06925 [Clostridiales bacterium]|nr:hypothetical protein [Clostridiales bacterium]